MASYRFYSFVNFYLSPIQHGIQTGHASVDLMVKYALDPDTQFDPLNEVVIDWAKDHKTYIILNGGNNETLIEAQKIIEDSGFPWVCFNEDEASLNNLRTCVGVILPDYIYEASYNSIASRGSPEPVYAATVNGENYLYSIGDKNYELVNLVKNCKLA